MVERPFAISILTKKHVIKCSRNSFSDKCFRRKEEEAARKAAEEKARREEEEKLKSPYILKREKTGEIIYINRTPFVVGRSVSKADYTIRNNSKISRSHVIFNIVDGVCFITDNDSLNKTFVNGKELRPLLKYELKSGDIIKLYDEKFVYIRDAH